MSGNSHQPSQRRAEQLAAQIRLAFEIAGEAARSDVECNCVAMRIGDDVWYDTQPIDPMLHDEAIDRSVRYLLMSGRLVKHPTKPTLVRFAS